MEIELSEDEQKLMKKQPANQFIKDPKYDTEREESDQKIITEVFERKIQAFDDKKVIGIMVAYVNPNKMQIAITERETYNIVMIWDVAKCLTRSSKITRLLPTHPDEPSMVYKYFNHKYSGSLLASQTARGTVPEAAFELFGWLLHTESQYVALLELDLLDYNGSADLNKYIIFGGDVLVGAHCGVDVLKSMFRWFVRPPYLTRFIRERKIKPHQTDNVYRVLETTILGHSRIVHYGRPFDSDFKNLTPMIRSNYWAQKTEVPPPRRVANAEEPSKAGEESSKSETSEEDVKNLASLVEAADLDGADDSESDEDDFSDDSEEPANRETSN